MIFVMISSNHNLSATLLPQPFPPSSSPSSRLRCGVGCPLVDCRELSAAKAARCLNPPRAHHVGDWKQEMPSCFVFSGSTNRRSGFTIFLLIVDRFSESFVWGNLKTKQTRFAREGVQTRTFPRLLLSIVFLNSFRTWFWFSVGDWKTVAALAAHEFFVEGVVRFSFVEHCWMDCPNSWCFAFRGNWPSSVVRSFLFEMCWIYWKAGIVSFKRICS